MTAVTDLQQYAESLDATFRTKVAKVERAQAILNGATLDIDLAGDDLAVVLGILAHHPSVAQKVGAGVASIHVSPAKMGSRCFRIVRVDGTTTDFSYIKCLRKTNSKVSVTQACREAVRPQVELVKLHWLWTDGTCQVTGLPISEETCHVHHAPPMFDRLTAEWAASRGGFDAVADRMRSGDNTYGATLSFDDEQSWLTYHDTHAVLQVIHAKANLSIEAARRAIQAG